MYFRRLTFAVLTILATFGALIITSVGAIEPWEATNETECWDAGGVWYEDDAGGWCAEPYTEDSLPDEGDWDPEADCVEYGGVWNGEWCDYPEWDPEADCVEYGGVWNGEWCDYGSIWDARDEGTCLERSGTWDAVYEWCSDGDYGHEDDGSLWSATNEVDCIDRGGNWAAEEDWGWCFEDSGEAWDARDEGTCLDRNGLWIQEEDWGWCFDDSGEAWDARDEGTCLDRGGTWDPQGGWCQDDSLYQDWDPGETTTDENGCEITTYEDGSTDWWCLDGTYGGEWAGGGYEYIDGCYTD
ncbi:MAG TPA: hypothetical protein QF762_02575, partial [Acidimicrobiales bacterium]|nr:hypothetical protein [Acidimicrobiales bacterium]